MHQFFYKAFPVVDRTIIIDCKTNLMGKAVQLIIGREQQKHLYYHKNIFFLPGDHLQLMRRYLTGMEKGLDITL